MTSPTEQALATFKKWLYLDDEAPVLAITATVVANRAAGDPVWLLLVGPPSGGKTEMLGATSSLPYVIPAATLTEASLLSGTPQKERGPGSTGGLLRQVGNFGILLAKDFTSVLSQNADTARSTMAALREVYDGSWSRPVGVDGGRVLHWAGKCGFIGGVTPSYDRFASFINALGDRFLLLRMPDVDAERQGLAALAHGENEGRMRSELAKAMGAVIEHANLDLVNAPLTSSETERLVRLAMFTAKIRTAVERDGYSKEVLVMPQAEGPARLVKAMRRLYGALLAIGVDDETRWSVLERVSFDCAPAMRLPLLRFVMNRGEWAKTGEIATATDMVTKSALRSLEDLMLLGIVDRDQFGDGDNSPYYWQASRWLRSHWPLGEVGPRSTTKRVEGSKEGDPGHSEQAPSNQGAVDLGPTLDGVA